MANTADRALRVPKTAELVANHIRRQIVNGQLREGDALPPEAALLQEFAISRPTLREAYRILESEGSIDVRRGAKGGAHVLEPTADTVARYAGVVLQHRNAKLADVLDARVFVEAPAARLLASRRDRVAVANELQALLDALDPDEVGRFHEFNDRVVALTGNQTLRLITTVLEHISAAAALSYVRKPHPEDDARLARKATRTRQRLIDLIRAGNAEAAEELWREHLEAAGRVLAASAGENLVDLFETP